MDAEIEGRAGEGETGEGRASEGGAGATEEIGLGRILPKAAGQCWCAQFLSV